MVKRVERSLAPHRASLSLTYCKLVLAVHKVTRLHVLAA
jgi:hypothetical protein